MTFSELKLLVAIDALNPGGRDYHEDERLEFAVRVQARFCLIAGDTFFPYRLGDVFQVYMLHRKNESAKMKAKIAAAHGTRCFWENRGKGPCSDEAEAGHLVPRCHKGELTVENCIIECRAHNNQRREMLVEEYLLSGLTTDVIVPMNSVVPY